MPEKKDTSATAMVTGGINPHVVFLPFSDPSHTLTLVHVARLFSARCIRSTIITTVQNAIIFKTSVDQEIAAGHPISVHTVDFPSPEVELSIRNMMLQLRTPIEQIIRDLAPDCIFSDMFLPWTVDIADELKIPRLMFYPFCFFYHCVYHSLKVHAPHANVKSESERFLIPGLPHEITMKRSQVTNHFKFKTSMGEMMEMILESEKRSHGLVYNTFYEIEPAYADHIKKIKGTKIWHIGPLFRFFNDGSSETHNCLSWLDDQKPKSVIYICFGSMARFPYAQITEIASALEELKHPFIWVLRKGEDRELSKLGFVEKIRSQNKGLIITGWVPQVTILQHPAVGMFMSHCGWNSLMEAMVSGVPVITWPLFAEQFYNEKLVELLGIGVGVGAEVWNPSFEITSPVIGKKSIVEGVEKLTTGSAIFENIISNLKEVAMKAKHAVGEGGSSLNDLTALIDDIKAFKSVTNA